MEEDKQNGGVTVVLKADFHCGGCAFKCIRSFDVVELGEPGGRKTTVLGKVDPVKLLDKVEQKTNKKVKLISPQQAKKDGGEKENAKGNGDDRKEKKKDNNGGGDGKKSADKSYQKGPMEKEAKKFGGEKGNAKGKDSGGGKKDKIKGNNGSGVVTVTGAMDMKALDDVLQKQLKRDVAVVRPKKEKGGGDGKGKSGDENVQRNKMQAPSPVHPHPFMFGLVHAVGDQLHYNPYGSENHAPQIFSDENPNACSVM